MSDALSPDRLAGGLSERTFVAERYDDHIDHPAEIAGILNSLMPAGARVLDAGCGTGSVTLLANRGKDNAITCLEPDPSRAAIARSRGLSVHCGYLDQAFVRREGPFDVVMSADVIEHSPDPLSFLRLLREAVRPNGHILLSTPNVAHWSVRFELAMGRFDYQPTGIMDVTHLRWFTEKTLRSLVETCDLHIRDVRHSAGIDLMCYATGAWKFVPYRVRVPLARRAVKIVPRLFGVQHVMLLQRPDA